MPAIAGATVHLKPGCFSDPQGIPTVDGGALFNRRQIDHMSRSDYAFSSKILRRSPSAKDYSLYRAGLEWSLIDPIIINSRADLKSEARWRGLIEPFNHQVTNLINFCRRLPVTLLADDVGLGKTISAGLIASELVARRRVMESSSLRQNCSDRSGRRNSSRSSIFPPRSPLAGSCSMQSPRRRSGRSSLPTTARGSISSASHRSASKC